MTRHHRPILTGTLTGVAGLALLMLPVGSPDLSAQARSDQTPAMHSPQHEMPDEQDVRAMRPARTASASQIAAAPASYYGETVVVDGNVAGVLHAHYFTLDEDAWFAGPDVGVIVPNPLPAGVLRRHDDIVLTGRVQRVTTSELERDFDWFDVDEFDFDYETNPVIIAEAIRTDEGRHVTSDDGSRPYLISATAGQIANRPARFYGRHVSVTAEVEDLLSDSAFTLDEDRVFAGPDVLVIHNTAMAVPEDEFVTVKGQVRPYDTAGLERDYDWFDIGMFDRDPGELDADAWGFDRRAVLVAQVIERAMN